MAKFKNILLRKLLASGRNLVSLDDHYATMQKLLRDHLVSGLLDAGASDGRVTRKLLKAFPQAQAYLFEAHPDYGSALTAYAQRDARVKPQFKVLSNKTGEQKLILCSAIGKTSLLSLDEKSARASSADGESTRTVKVESTTIDDWALTIGSPAIDVMKFDIQAGELLALQGATRTLAASTKLIYTEIFFNPMYEGGALLGDIDAFLRDHGFVIYDIYKPKYRPDGALSYANVIFIREDLLS